MDEVSKFCRQLSHSVERIRLHSDEGKISPKYSKSLNRNESIF